MILFALILLLLGSFLTTGALVLHWLRGQVDAYLAHLPDEMHDLLADSHPEIKKALAFRQRLPKIILGCGVGGALLLLLGLVALPSVWLQLIALLALIGFGLGVKKLAARLGPLLSKRLLQTMRNRL